MSAPRSALVSGASSGIGAAIVRDLAEAGLRVWALARRADRLADLAAATGCEALPVDVMDSAALAAVVGGLDPDILVNNAGLGAGITGLAASEHEDIARTIGTNVTALLDLTRQALPGMKERGIGHIVNIGSVAGLYPSPSAIYGGSKGAVHLICQSLRLELRGTGIRVTEICPGRVATEFYDVAIDDAAERARATDHGITELSPGDVANSILHVLNAPRHVSINQIELTPTEQVYGGYEFSPIWTG